MRLFPAKQDVRPSQCVALTRENHPQETPRDLWAGPGTGIYAQTIQRDTGVAKGIFLRAGSNNPGASDAGDDADGRQDEATKEGGIQNSFEVQPHPLSGTGRGDGMNQVGSRTTRPDSPRGSKPATDLPSEVSGQTELLLIKITS